MISPVLAKKNGETLCDHTQNCLRLFVIFKNLFPGLDQKCGYPKFYDDIATALFFHDFGKAAIGFQKQFRPGNPKYHYRHEILSVPFVASLHRQDTEFIKELVLTHHKTLDKLSDYVEQEDSIDPSFAERLSEIKENLPYLDNLIADFQQFPGCSEMLHAPQKITSLDFSKECWEDVLRSMYRENRESLDKKDRLRKIFGKGFVNSCDYLASAGIQTIPKPLADIHPVIPFHTLTSVQKTAGRTKGNAIITAPTGSGKTEAALFWATYNLDPNWGNRVFYTLPYTASINAMYLRLKNIFSRGYAEEDTCVSLMHGKAAYYLWKFYENSERFDFVKSISKRIYSPYKVMTPFQSIKHFFSLKGYEMGLLEMYRGLFIFDEIHAYDAKNTALILGMTDYLVNTLDAKVLIMSATLPTFIRSRFAECLHVSEEIHMTVPELSRYLRHHCAILDGEIFDHLDLIKQNLREKKKVLIVCNTVQRAQDVYESLKNETENRALLHGKFILNDRERIENSLSERTLLVGTQTIEVSLDIDYDVCFTEPAPVDALIQRFGRVNRRKNPDGTPLKGICPVFVFTKGSDNDRFIYPEQKVTKTLDLFSGLDLLHENLLQDITDQVYDDGFGSKEAEFTETQHLFLHLVEEQQPYCSSSRSESDFYRLFSAVEAVPFRYAATYDECIQSGKIYDAMKYVVPLTLGQYHKLKSENRVSENRDRIVIDARYDTDTGLLIGERDPAATII
ncbi:MAG TPA: CRISPR-associated helicase Cas3' [Methanoregula sp.]|nr:CRISPR-associated helicase Cas3' [Methanoregula sp.]